MDTVCNVVTCFYARVTASSKKLSSAAIKPAQQVVEKAKKRCNKTSTTGRGKS